jgi:hypothetical protein
MTEDTALPTIKRVIRQLETAKTSGLIKSFGISFEVGGQPSFTYSQEDITYARRAIYIEFHKDVPRDVVLNLREHFGTKYHWICTIMAVDMLKVELPRE